MYVTFGLVEKGGHYFMNQRTLGFCFEEPVGTDFYVKDEDYPEIFLKNQCAIYPEGYESEWRNFPKWRFDPDAYARGERCFVPFDPTKDEYFMGAVRRIHINDQIADTMPMEAELKTARKMITALFQILVDNGLAAEIPEDLQEWNNAVADSIADYPTKYDQADELYLEERDDIVNFTGIRSDKDADLGVRHRYRTVMNRVTALRVAQARRGQGALKNFERTKARNQRREVARAKKKAKARTVQGPASNQRP